MGISRAAQEGTRTRIFALVGRAAETVTARRNPRG